MFHLALTENKLERQDKGWLGYSLTQRDKTSYGKGVLSGQEDLLLSQVLLQDFNQIS